MECFFCIFCDIFLRVKGSGASDHDDNDNNEDNDDNSDNKDNDNSTILAMHFIYSLVYFLS